MRAAPAAAALVVLLALAGCGAAGLGGGTTTDDGSSSAPAPDGGDQVGNPDAEIPATFPADLPLVDGEVLEAADLGTGWVVLLSVDDALAAFTEATDALLAAGLREDTRNSSETEGFAQYTGDLYTVQVTAAVDYPGYGPAVNYTVVKLGE